MAMEKSMEVSHGKKVQKYGELRKSLEQEHPGIGVRQYTLVVSPTGYILKQYQKEFTAATALPRDRLALQWRNIVDTALRAANEDCESFVQHFMKARNIRGMIWRYETTDSCLQEMADDVRKETQEASIMDVEVEVGENGRS
jgi:hypothetical protein